MRIAASLLLALLFVTACLVASAQEAPQAQSEQLLMRAKSALAAAGTIRATLKLEANYPSPYTSEITILASPTGEERAEMKTTVGENSYNTLEVISKGILWTEESTPAGTVVSMIDINRVRRTLRDGEVEFAALPALGTNLLFDVSNLSRFINFNSVSESTGGERRTLTLSGELAAAFQKDKKALPEGAARYYTKAKVTVDGETFLPVRVELGEENGKPLVAIDFVSIEKNVEAGEEAFDYSPPADVDVIDRTEWALDQLLGR